MHEVVLSGDVWHLATPRQLLTLIQRLGVSGRVVARWLGVKPSAISMWSHGARAIPHRHVPALKTWAQTAFAQAMQRNDTDAAAQPTDELRRATRAALAAIWDRWKAEVLYDAGTLRGPLRKDYESLGQWLAKDPLTAEDRASIHLILENIRLRVDMLLASAVPCRGDIPVVRRRTSV